MHKNLAKNDLLSNSMAQAINRGIHSFTFTRCGMKQDSDYIKVLDDVLEISTIASRRLMDPKDLSSFSAAMNRVVMDKTKIKQEGKNYSNFYSDIFTRQQDALTRGNKDGAMNIMLDALADGLGKPDVMQGLGDDYPHILHRALNFFSEQRDMFAEGGAEYKAIDTSINRLVSKPDVVVFVNPEILTKQGLLSVEGTGPQLEKNLKIIEAVACDQQNDIVPVLADQIKKQIALREEFYVNGQTAVADLNNIKMQDVYDNLDDITHLKQAYARLIPAEKPDVAL